MYGLLKILMMIIDNAIQNYITLLPLTLSFRKINFRFCNNNLSLMISFN
jgi:hypothetical protein